MTTDNKTLADAQPGGRVRLGDQAERARFEAWAEGAGYALTREDGRYEFAATRCAWTAWRAAAESRQIGAHEPAAWVPPNFFNKGVVAATARRNPPSETAAELRGEYVPLYLSAQPSPGGQDAPEIEQLRALVYSILSTVSLGHQKGPYAYAGEDFGRHLAEAARDCRTILRGLSDIAARQPVGVVFPWEKFPAYLIDKCEGDTISEEGLQQALASMAKDENYCLAARQPVGQSQTHWGWLVDGVPFKGSSTCEMSAVPLYAGEPDPPLVVRVPRHEAAPYFECKPEQWEQHTHGMTTAGKNVLANMLAHHCLLARRDELGWIITRYDLIAEGRPWWHVSNNGKLTYDYDPATKARMVAAPPAQAVDLGPGVKAIADERERQLQAEGFTRDSDQQYRRGELAKAATAYVQLAAMDLEAGGRSHIAWHGPAAVWPWAPEWWKPVDARRDLVRAGALIAAQIDLIDSQAVGK
jgi:hypothetical protein